MSDPVVGTYAAAGAPALAFEDFYRGGRDRVVRALALTLGDAHLAAEATDEAMARAFQRWDRVARLDNPGGWVYRISGNYGPDDAVPPEAIVGAWKVADDGTIIGEFMRNPNFNPSSEAANKP